MILSKRFGQTTVAIVIALLSAIAVAAQTERRKTHFTINRHQYLEKPGLSVLVFRNDYAVGHQGGIEIIHHGVRIATNGQLSPQLHIPVQPAIDKGVEDWSWPRFCKLLNREIDRDTCTITAQVQYPENGFTYTVTVQGQGDSINLTVDLDKPLPKELDSKIGFSISLFPPEFFGKTWQLDNSFGIFPRQAKGPISRDENGNLMATHWASGPELCIAGEDPQRAITITSAKNPIQLFDERDQGQNGWFIIRSPISAGQTKNVVQWTIRPNVIPSWRRSPVICHSQVGYHPDQAKRVPIELDKRTQEIENASLFRLNLDGTCQEVISEKPDVWGDFLRYKYATFDFTSVSQPGMYFIRYGKVASNPFKISRDVFRENVWQPTLGHFFPVQMCHMRVRDRAKVWHGACHLDDARQAPPSLQHFDGYSQGPSTYSKYEPYEHIPGINVGGWHDAGDYDLFTWSQYTTTYTLIVAYEEFDIDYDQTTVIQNENLAIINKPDGIPDIIQQIEHGVLYLLACQKALGHSVRGIIAPSFQQYVIFGDGASMTDNKVDDKALTKPQVSNEVYGTGDDRLVFTNYDEHVDMDVAKVLAAAARVLKGYNDKLAQESLRVSEDILQKYHNPEQPSAREITTTLELLKTTGKTLYRKRIEKFRPILEQHAADYAAVLIRFKDIFNDEELMQTLRSQLANRAQNDKSRLEETPFNIHYKSLIWGIGWQLTRKAVNNYYLIKEFPDIYDRETLLSTVNYVLGCHPGSNVSFVSGVGSKSLTIAYGHNRGDWHYVPGGVASGTALIQPDFPELKDNYPLIWQQAEYVIHGAATYLFTVNAADTLLNKPPGK